jgi:hypothetical protein
MSPSASNRTPDRPAPEPVVAGASLAAPATTMQFSHLARLLARETRRRGLVTPGFRCPPRVVGAQRTVRRHTAGITIAVQLKGRPWAAVVADMVEGVVVANALTPPHADRLRTDLWQIIGDELPEFARVATSKERVA